MNNRYLRKNFVIDADIARAANDLSNNISARCNADVLCSIQRHHSAVFSRRLLEEWKKHHSSFASRWLASMLQQNCVNFSDKEQPQLRKEVIKCCPGRESVIDKDFHLLEAAIEYDRIVLSCDKKARNCFSVAAHTVKELENILWQNPSVDKDLIVWIEKNAPFDIHRCLKSGE